MAKIDISSLPRPTMGEPKVFHVENEFGSLTLKVRELLQVEQMAMFSYGDQLALALEVDPVIVGNEVVHAPANVALVASALTMAQVGNDNDLYSERDLIALMVHKEFLQEIQKAYAFAIMGDSPAKRKDDDPPLALKK